VCLLKFGCSFGLREGNLDLIPNHPSTLIGLTFDRPVVGYGGTTVNTLRLWSAVAPDHCDFRRWFIRVATAALSQVRRFMTI
jgi:starch phosphorylase